MAFYCQMVDPFSIKECMKAVQVITLSVVCLC